MEARSSGERFLLWVEVGGEVLGPLGEEKVWRSSGGGVIWTGLGLVGEEKVPRSVVGRSDDLEALAVDACCFLMKRDRSGLAEDDECRLLRGDIIVLPCGKWGVELILLGFVAVLVGVDTLIFGSVSCVVDWVGVGSGDSSTARDISESESEEALAWN